MSRKTKYDYDGPGSFDRIREAAYSLADADTSEAADGDFHRADMRLRQAVVGYTRATLERLLSWQRKGGRARAKMRTPEEHRAWAREAARRRWAARE